MIKKIDNIGLRELTEKRQQHLKSCQSNDDKSISLLAEKLYTDKIHFIYELLQNADDSKAQEVWLEVDNDKLKFSHNGKEFDIDDVKSITTMASSTKALESNKIGKFGVGFKSIFSITDSPKFRI